MHIYLSKMGHWYSLGRSKRDQVVGELQITGVAVQISDVGSQHVATLTKLYDMNRTSNINTSTVSNFSIIKAS